MVMSALLAGSGGGALPRPPRPPPRPPPPRAAFETPAYAVSAAAALPGVGNAGAAAPIARTNLPSLVNSRIWVSRGPTPPIQRFPFGVIAIPLLALGQV